MKEMGRFSEKQYYGKFISAIIFFCLTLHISAETQDSYKVNHYDFDINHNVPESLDLKTAILMVLKNNTTVNLSRLDIVKSTLPVYNYYSTFNWTIYGYAQSYKAVLPSNATAFFSGNKISRDMLGLGIEKNFMKGTYLSLEANTLRFDSNAFESNQTAPALKILAVPPLYTGAIKVMVSQELLKNSFGLNHENTIKILKLNSLTTIDSLVLQLTGLVADTLVKYWMLEVYDSSIATYANLLENTQELQRITRRKIPLGIAESFELNRWNSLVLNGETSLANVRLMKENSERELFRILNADPRTKIQGVTELKTELPVLDLVKDIEYALDSRIDLRLLKKKNEILSLNKKTLVAQSLPSLKMSLEYSTIGQNTISPQTNFQDTANQVPSLKYPDFKGQINLVYPLSDLETETGIRDTESMLQQNKTDIQDTEKQIKEEMELRYNKIQSDYILYKDAIKVSEEAEKFYQNLLVKYRSGKYSSELVKTALDFVAQSRMAVIQTKVNFNVSLLLYDLSKNYIFPKYGIDIRSYIDVPKVQTAGSK